MDIEVVQRIERIEAQCRAGHNALHLPESEQGRQLQTLALGGATVEISGHSPDTRVGRVYGFGLSEPATEDALDSILEALTEARTAAVRFRAPPTEQRAEVTEWLKRRGLKRSTVVVHWIAATAPLREVDTAHQISRLREGDRETFGQLIALHYHLKPPGSAAFHARLEEIPGMVCYMAFDGEKAVGTGALYRDEEGCIVEYGTTLGPYRKQGLQRAMIGYRLNAAAAAGLRWACASTIGSDRSSRNLVRQGFQKAYDAPVFTRTFETS